MNLTEIVNDKQTFKLLDSIYKLEEGLLDEGRRVIPHTKSEMGLLKKEIDTGVDKPDEPASTPIPDMTIDLGGFLLCAYTNLFSAKSNSFFAGTDSCIDVSSARPEILKTTIDKNYFVPSENVSNGDTIFSLVQKHPNGTIQDLFGIDYINLIFECTEGVTHVHSMRTSNGAGPSVSLKILMPDVFNSNTFPAFNVVMFAEFKQKYPELVQQLIDKVKEKLNEV